jgi:hypothetical protein
VGGRPWRGRRLKNQNQTNEKKGWEKKGKLTLLGRGGDDVRAARGAGGARGVRGAYGGARAGRHAGARGEGGGGVQGDGGHCVRACELKWENVVFVILFFLLLLLPKGTRISRGVGEFGGINIYVV